MPPFTPKYVTRYLLWVVLVIIGVLALAWYLFQAPARERIHSKRSGATVQLRLPGVPSQSSLSHSA